MTKKSFEEIELLSIIMEEFALKKCDIELLESLQISEKNEVLIKKILQYVHQFKEIVLLKEKTVLQWIFGDTSFLTQSHQKSKSKFIKEMKIVEDKWGQEILHKKRPDLKLDGQWTNIFGEYICMELCILNGKIPSKPLKKQNMQPDYETEDYIWEAKTQTYFTTGTAGEKILGVPIKYRNVPILYGKPLKILCIGCAEKECREHYGNLPGEKLDELMNEILDFFKNRQIEFIGASDILKKMI